MTVDLNDITSRVGRWLSKNGLPREGVKVTIEFPDEGSVHRAENCIMREIEPMRLYPGMASFGRIETMNGIGLSLRFRKSGEAIHAIPADR